MRFQYDPVTDTNVKINDRYHLGIIVERGEEGGGGGSVLKASVAPI